MAAFPGFRLTQEWLRRHQGQDQFAEAESGLAESFVQRIDVGLVGLDFTAALGVAEDLLN
jgi:hypothetical protein